MKRVKGYFRWALLGGLWLLVLLLVGWGLWEKDGFWDYMALQNQKTALLEEGALLKEKNRQLVRQVHRLQEDSEYVGVMAMEQLGMLPKHAQVYLFEDPDL